MLTLKHDKTNQLSIEITGKLKLEDFDKLAKVADDLIEKHGKLRLFINGSKFAGWHDFATMRKHFSFVRGHHHYVEKIAVITGPWWQNFMFLLAKIFIHPKVKAFKIGKEAAAIKWLNA